MAGKEAFVTGSFTYGATKYVLTTMNYSENYGEIDVTDTGTSGDGKEYLGSRAERTFSIGLFVLTDIADITMNTEAALIMDFEGKTYAGSGSLLTKTIDGSIDSAVTATYTGRFNGEVTVTPEA